MPTKSHREVTSSLLLLSRLLPLRMFVIFNTSESLALQTLLTSLASTHRLPPYSTIGGSSSLLSRTRTRALGAHGPGARERVAATSTTDVNHAGRRDLGGC